MKDIFEMLGYLVGGAIMIGVIMVTAKITVTLAVHASTAILTWLGV